jgi:hypothetical protein
MHSNGKISFDSIFKPVAVKKNGKRGFMHKKHNHKYQQLLVITNYIFSSKEASIYKIL